MIDRFYLKEFNRTRCTILIFDSGVGGLSIYDKIRQILPNLHYVYVFDNAAFPYGEKEKGFIVNRVLKIISIVRKKFTFSLAVIACNTVSTLSLSYLRKKFFFPIVGVVPAIKLAARLTRNKIIGLLATKSTTRSPYVCTLIERFAVNCQVIMLDSVELVELAEWKMRGEIVLLADLRRILQPWFRISAFPDAIVLGCTHFLLLKEELLAVLPSDTYLIDPSQAVAYHTAWILNHMAHVELHEKTIESNVALCTSLTEDIRRLLPIFNFYGFETLTQLTI